MTAERSITLLTNEAAAKRYGDPSQQMSVERRHDHDHDAPGWRQMRDFPICRERVLVYDPALGIVMAYFETGRGWTDTDASNRVMIKPTHWHPLPKHPTSRSAPSPSHHQE
jgi:hypothetical protein